MKPITILLLFFITVAPLQSRGQSSVKDSVLLLTANGHPIQYYVSLPDGWTNQKNWPIVVIIESADKEYKENALRFVRARKKMPFIIVAPYNLNNSRYGRRDPKIFPYSSQTWDYIETVGDCRFNMDGLTQVVKDVQIKYNGDEKYYITGFEAGAHTVWQMVFQHPERLKAAAVVAGNYNQNSCMTDPDSFSTDLAKVVLPVIGFAAANDTFFKPGTRNYSQWLAAKKAGVDHGYKKIAEIIIPLKNHVPLPDEVMNYFYDLLVEEKKE